MTAMTSQKRAGRTTTSAPTTRRRAVLLDPQGPNGPRWVRTSAEHAHAHGLDIVCVASDLTQALAEVVAGRADVVVVPRPEDLAPLVLITTLPVLDTPARPADRRPRRLR